MKLSRLKRLPRAWPGTRVLSSVRGRIIAGIGSMVVILVAVAAVSAWQVLEYRSNSAELQRRGEITFLLLDAQANAESAAASVQRYVIVGDEVVIPGNDDILLPLIEETTSTAVDDLTQAIVLEKAQGDAEDAASLAEILAEGTALVQGVGQIIAFRQSGNVEEATAAFEEIVLPFREFESNLNEAAEFERAEALALREAADRAGALAFWVLVISGSLGAVLGLVGAALVARSILKPLSAVERTALAVADGDLKARSPETGPDELVRLSRSINTMTEALLDASKRRALEEALQESEALHRDLVETSQDLIWRCDPEGRFTFLNKAWETTHGYRLEEMLGRPFTDFMTPEVASRDIEEFRRLMDDGSVTGYETTHISKSGDEIDLVFNAIPLLDSDGQQIGTQGTANDVTERKRAEETIRHLAYHDGLTGLPNRRLFMDRLNLALAQARRGRHMIAVLFLDLDHFKVVNDSVGHVAGDELLRSAAERLTGLVREGDTVSRMGGDEFTILLPDIEGVEEATEVAERAIEACRRPWHIDGHAFHVAGSIGIALYPNDGQDAESLLRNADTAMYRAKEQGRNNYQFYVPAMNARVAERLALETGLRNALERDELVVRYQAQVDLGSGRIVGTEALVRWQHPERGLVLPDEFILLAEETGLVAQLDEWVLRTACAQNAAWQQAGRPPMRVAVNISARQFRQRGLADTVAKALEDAGLDPQCLQLEITEGVAMQDADSTIATLSELREMGVRIAIDDFGTGHSSLSYLKRFPIDVLKIDRSFVCDLTTDPDDAAIAATIIAMAKSLNLKVIAEGVETEEQLAFLKEHGCDEMQGFLFSKPVPAEEFEEMLRRDGGPSAAREVLRANRQG